MRGPRRTPLHTLADPDKIFIGGSNGALLAILKYAWQRLALDGCLVVSCVTEECKCELMHFMQQLKPSAAIEQISLAISQAERLAGKQLMRPQLPVQLTKISKDCHAETPQ